MTNTPIGGSLPEPPDVPLAEDEVVSLPEPKALYITNEMLQEDMDRAAKIQPSDGWALRAAKRILANTTLVGGSEGRMASIILHEFAKHQRSLRNEWKEAD